MATHAIEHGTTSGHPLWRLLSGTGALAACVIAVTLAVLGDPREQPASTTLVTSSISAVLLAPFFWPLVASEARPIVSLAAWCCTVPLVATAVAYLFAAPRLLIEPVLASAGLAAVMALTLETILIALTCLRRGMHPRCTAIEMDIHRVFVVGAFAAASLAPVWLGPAAELAGNSAALPSVAVGVSPLMHIADAARCDLLRQNWFYAHSNLGALRVTYLPWQAAAAVYLGIAAILAVLIGTRLAAKRSGQPHTLVRTEDISCV